MKNEGFDGIKMESGVESECNFLSVVGRIQSDVLKLVSEVEYGDFVRYCPSERRQNKVRP